MLSHCLVIMNTPLHPLSRRDYAVSIGNVTHRFENISFSLEFIEEVCKSHVAQTSNVSLSDRRTGKKRDSAAYSKNRPSEFETVAPFFCPFLGEQKWTGKHV